MRGRGSQALVEAERGGEVNIQHSTRTDLWYTPAPLVEMARLVLGPIDLDPASDEHGNETIQAARFITEDEDGLSADWGRAPSTVWLNPPGGKVGRDSRAGLFWRRLMAHRDAGLLQHAVFLAFSAEALQNTQGKGTPAIMDFPFCIPAKRVRFRFPYAHKDAPSHSNAVVYVPGLVNRTDSFVNVFSALGLCKR